VLSIVHVLSSYGVGGQERVALDLAIGQRARGHRVAVISIAPAPDGAMAEEFRAAGIEVGRVAKRNGVDPTLVPRLTLAFRRLGAQVIHTHNPQPLIYGAPAARLAGARAIHTKHGKNPMTRGQLALRRMAARLVTAFVAVSEATAEQARVARDVSPGKLHVITNGIRLERYAPDPAARAAVRAELGLGDAWVIGTVGRVDDNKNHVMLIRAFAALPGNPRLVIVGDGPARATVEAEIAKLDLGARVILTGRRMDVPRLVHAFDTFALSSILEGLPLVIPEAMAAGLPVVATAVGGLPDVIDEGHTGLLVPVDERALAQALGRLSADRELAKRLGAQARVVALDRYGFEGMVDKYLALYG
jgi:glycosyltransferase involved in cell wall biosynthesis